MTANSRPEPAWIGSASNPGALVAAALLPTFVLATMMPAAVGAGVPLLFLIPGALVACLVAATAMSYVAVRVIVTPTSITVGLGPWGWPSRMIPLSDVREASSAIVSPLDYGGWGHRLGRRGSAIVIRAGAALVLDLKDGEIYTVTVNSADQAAMFVNAYRLLR